MSGVTECQGVVGKGCIAVAADRNVGDASSAIALHRPGNVAGPGVAAPGVEEARVKRNSIARPAEPETAAEGVAHRHSLHPPAKGDGQAFDVWNCMGQPTAVEILIGGGHDLLAGL